MISCVEECFAELHHGVVTKSMTISLCIEVTYVTISTVSNDAEFYTKLHWLILDILTNTRPVFRFYKSFVNR